ncbi:MAG: hypothetical protein BWY90_01399 [Deltaproteobacteria bacterium ADurb.BinA014]|nr:MAG: hypothetical protein BWY90_01399 [Deltaproteobacteria bacterium ADurb.BinA014]
MWPRSLTASTALRIMFKNASPIIDASTFTVRVSANSVRNSICLSTIPFSAIASACSSTLTKSAGAFLGSIGLAKTNILLTSSSRCSTSFSAILNLFKSLPVGFIRFSSICKLILIEERGLRTSCAMPADNCPKATSFSLS